MKNVILIIIISSFSIMLSAQNSGIEIRPIVGSKTLLFSGDKSVLGFEGEYQFIHNRHSYEVGVEVSKNVNHKWSLSTGVIYDYQDYSINMMHLPDMSSVNENEFVIVGKAARVNSFSIPLTIRRGFSINESLQPFIGLGVSTVIWQNSFSMKIEDPDKNYTASMNTLNKLRARIIVEAGANFTLANQNFSLSAYWTMYPGVQYVEMVTSNTPGSGNVTGGSHSTDTYFGFRLKYHFKL